MNSVIDKALEFKNRYASTIAWRIKKHAKVVEDYINPGEEVLYVFCGQKNAKFSEFCNTFVVALTNKRLLLGHKKVFWGSFLYSITPDLYNDMEVFRGLLWGKITIDTVKEKVVLTNISNNALDEIETNISEFMMKEKKLYKVENKI